MFNSSLNTETDVKYHAGFDQLEIEISSNDSKSDEEDKGSHTLRVFVQGMNWNSYFKFLKMMQSENIITYSDYSHLQNNFNLMSSHTNFPHKLTFKTNVTDKILKCVHEWNENFGGKSHYAKYGQY